MKVAFMSSVPNEVREVEKQIDNAFKTNFLAGLNFTEAIWYLLATAEHKMLEARLESVSGFSKQQALITADRFLTHIQYPISWLWSHCEKTGQIPYINSEQPRAAALDLINLASLYRPFVAAFVNATKGLLELSLLENEIVTTLDLQDTRYEAYNRLIKTEREQARFDVLEIRKTVEKKVRVRGDRFSYRLDPKTVAKLKGIVQPIYDEAFTLPLEWRFSRYSLQDFFEFASFLSSMAFTHATARHVAVDNKCIGLGYKDGVLIFDYQELIAKMKRYSGLKHSVVIALVEDLTYGNRGIKNPDPALQPLIPLANEKLAIAPSIFLSSSMERNFTVLINRFPSEQKIYLELINEKEDRMRNSIVTQLPNEKYRIFHGSIPQDDSLPDLDLVIISDQEKVCLITELKWFIYPDEINEVILKSEELAKGIGQLKKIKTKVQNNFEPLFEAMKIDQEYTIGFAVVSANWIGFDDVQDIEIPIINQRHLVHKIQHDDTLLTVLEWLDKRNYLPVKDKHYSTVDDVAEIEDWKLKWYGIKPLINSDFLPL